MNLAFLSKNTTIIENLLTPDFEERQSSNPITPMPREEWIKQMLNPKEKDLPSIEEMAVHDFGEIRVVSYRLSNKHESTFIVDIWKLKDNKNQLAVRYTI